MTRLQCHHVLDLATAVEKQPGAWQFHLHENALRETNIVAAKLKVNICTLIWLACSAVLEVGGGGVGSNIRVGSMHI